MDSQGHSNGFAQSHIRRTGMALTAQLVKASPQLHSIDDIFLWFANIVVHTFDIQVMQIWTVHAYGTGQRVLELRTLVRRDASLPQHVVVNRHVADVAQQVLNEQRTSQLYSIEQLFSAHQASLILRYGLRFCVASALLGPGLLPPPPENRPSVMIATPTALTMLLLLDKPLPSEVQGSIDYAFLQALQFALNRGFLLPLSNAVPSLQGYQQQMRAPSPPQITFGELIARRREDTNLLRAANPLTSASPIPDKQARRLYAAIDGHKTMRELESITQLTEQEVYKAVQVLLAEHRIQFYGLDGQLVDSSQLFPHQ